MFPNIDPHHSQKWIYHKYPIIWSWFLYWYALSILTPKKDPLWKDFKINWNLAWLEEEEY